MTTEEKKTKYLALRSMFLSGQVRRMKDIEKIYPTMVAKDLGINHGRYVNKLYKPQEFSIKHIIILANLLEIDPQIIIKIILNQLNSQKVPRKNKK